LRSKKLLAIEDLIFTERRIRFYGRGVIVAYLIALAWRLTHGQWIFLADGRLRCVDFGWIWLSGRFTVSDNATHVFDYSTFSAAQITLFGLGNCPFIPQFDYPPTSLFLTYPLGWLPYVLAFAVWTATTFLLYAVAIYAIIPRRVAVIAAIAPFCVAVNVDFGHNGFLTAALIGLTLACLERGPWLSGIFLGLLTYKPQFGVLFPVALLASRNWQVLTSAAVLSVFLALAAAFAFGFEGWVHFLHALLDRQSTLSPDAAVPLALHSVFGLLRWAEASASISWVGHIFVGAIATFTVFAVWANRTPFALKAAFLCIGSALVSPYILFYDLCILPIAVAFLVRDGMSRGFLRGERTLFFLCFVAFFLVQVPIGPVVCAALFFLCVRRIFGVSRLDRSAFPEATNNFETTAMVRY
jgi:Glycosyltransferase family 87